MAILFLVHDSFGSHPKVYAIPRARRNRALGLWALAGSWSARYATRGTIPREVVHALGAGPTTARDLVDAELWDVTVDGFAFREGDGIWRFSQNGRVAIPDAVRGLVYARDGYRCVVCGTSEDLTLDHIWPWSLGGSDEPGNLQTMCRPHNSAKGARVDG